MRYIKQCFTMSEEDVVYKWQKFKRDRNVRWVRLYYGYYKYELRIDNISVLKAHDSDFSGFRCLKAMYVYEKKYNQLKIYEETQNKYK